MSGMDSRRIFEVLGISETKEEERIREAYREKLVSVNPEDNPEGFKRLREAYESALRMARQQEEEETAQDTPAGLFIKDAEKLYRSLPRRLDAGEWERFRR